MNRAISIPSIPLPILIVLVAAGAPVARGDCLHADDAAVSFRNEVMAVLSKAGCNSGSCHGNQNGKGGFKLSLRGQDPELDYFRLTREFGSRRINLLSPRESLVLLKPTGRLTHQGGVRFQRDDPEYQILFQWIAGGAAKSHSAEPRLVDLQAAAPSSIVVTAPQDSIRLEVTARFSNGEQRDVTQLAVFETSNNVAIVEKDASVRRQRDGETTVLVRYLDRQVAVSLAFIPKTSGLTWDAPPAQNYIDRFIDAKLKKIRILPSGLCDDSTFVRRAFLDTLGVTPSAEQAKAFFRDRRVDKRSRLIDRLLNNDAFAEHWALKWSDILRNEEKVLDARGVKMFYRWLKDSFAQGKPLDRLVRELVASKGSTYHQPAANYYRASRDPFTRSETTARLFMGFRLQCAKCHNHPFDRWTQDDYYNWASLFSRVDYKIVENKRRDKFDKNEFVGEQIVLHTKKGKVQNPRTGRPANPVFLGDTTTIVKPSDGMLEQLADWLTSPGNLAFAQSQVNFIWYHLMGRGLVEPIDDFRATNPAVNPPLLEALAKDFRDHRFDLRHMVRTIMNSRAYQTSWEPNSSNLADQSNFSRGLLRRLTAEKLLDAQSSVLDAPPHFAGYPLGIRAGQVPGVRKVRRRDRNGKDDGDRFLRAFGKPQRILACECERSNETTLSQAFFFLSGESLHERLSRPQNRLDRWINAKTASGEIVDELFWTTLARPPTPKERRQSVQYLDKSENRREALEDLAWAVMNAKEFIFRM